MGGKSKKAKRLHIVLSVCAFALVGLYLFEVNSIARGRFALEKTRLYIEEIRKKNNVLEIEASEAKSLYNLASLSTLLDLEEVKRVSYIKVKSAAPLVLSN